MGILGLTTYMNNYHYLKYYELHDTYLVIDGNNICCQLFYTRANCNSAFGGDYDDFAQHVSDFFDDLLKCNITPIVLIDGGTEDRKLKTVIKRTKERIYKSSLVFPNNNIKHYCLLLLNVFKDIMKEKNIQYIQCLFEADNEIAVVAKSLDCPVLSYDSDFYIYGTMYIPFNTLSRYVTEHPSGNSCIKCKIYKVEYLLQSFEGLNQSMLPLAAILLGNDYVKHSTFKNFFRHLKLKGASGKKFNHQLCRIEAIFNWLSKHTLDKAIIQILSRIVKPKRQNILNLIEDNINIYTNVSSAILTRLNFLKIQVVHTNTHNLYRSFKFDEDINSLTYIEEIFSDDDDDNDNNSSDGDDDDDDDNDNEENKDDGNKIVKPFNEFKAICKNVDSNLPVWFVNNFFMGKYPKYFMDIIIQGLYICPIQVEDLTRPCSAIPSLKIISVICTLLCSAINDRINHIKYLIRNQMKIVYRTLYVTDYKNFCKLHPSSTFRQISISTRKKILNDTLGIAHMDYINELPPEWMLYVGCIKYWINESIIPYKHCLYSIFMCMLFYIIDSKIGRYRSMHKFVKNYGKKIEVIKQERKKNNYKPCYILSGTIIEAYNEIDLTDCLLAAPFFISHFHIDSRIDMNPKKFDKSIVHGFAEFQCCLKHIMDLNILLECPYPQTKIANLFNGTLLYNLSDNFKTRYNIEEYINNMFLMSPSILRLYNMLLLKFKPFMPPTQISFKKKKKKKSKKKSKLKSKLKSDENLEETSSEHIDTETEKLYDDPTNPYYILCSF